MSKLKYIAIATLIFVVSFVGGCCGMDIHLKSAEASWFEKEKPQYRMELVSNDIDDFEIYKDTKTGVLYLVIDAWHGYGGGSAVCVMVDAEGKPLVSE